MKNTKSYVLFGAALLAFANSLVPFIGIDLNPNQQFFAGVIFLLSAVVIAISEKRSA